MSFAQRVRRGKCNADNVLQRSHEKNIILEETWKRNDANMRRKQTSVTNPAAGAQATSLDAPPSPAGTGAMDALMEKLRAAAPQTRATRDQRRRARLKDKHQVRVASGQKIPETGENVASAEGDTESNGLLSPTLTDGGTEEKLAEVAEGGGVSEGEDIADRAASLLSGLRGSADGATLSAVPVRDESLRIRRRRESADDERTRRRARRQRGGTSVDTLAAPSSVINEEGSEDTVPTTPANVEGEFPERHQLPSPPTTIVVPPSPTMSERHRNQEG